jgi:hypothetical protein
MRSRLLKFMKDNNEKNQLEQNQEPKLEEFGGPKGLEPTRYGVQTPEWEKNGRVSDF